MKVKILTKILGTCQNMSLLHVLITCPPLLPFQCFFNDTPFDFLNIEFEEGGGGEKVLNDCRRLLDI